MLRDGAATASAAIRLAAFAPRAAPMTGCMATPPDWCSDVQVDDASVAASTAVGSVEVGSATSDQRCDATRRDATAMMDDRARRCLSGQMRFAVEPHNDQHMLVSEEDAAAGRFERRLRVLLPHSADDPGHSAARP